jgi:small subunit ribosomal protein S13
MARIEGVILPANKRVEYALTYLHGIGLSRSRDILHTLGINFDIRVNQLSDQDVAAIQREIGDKYPIEGELRKKVHVDIQRLKEIGSYRGDRHKKGLPVRGQRTSTNARTRKGPKRAGMAVALKRKVTKK